MPEHGAYTGVFIDFGEAEEDVTLEGIEDFETMVGKHQAHYCFIELLGGTGFSKQKPECHWQHWSLAVGFLVAVTGLTSRIPVPTRFQSQFNHLRGRESYIHDWGTCRGKAFGKADDCRLCKRNEWPLVPVVAWNYGGNCPANEEKTKWQGPETFKRISACS